MSPQGIPDNLAVPTAQTPVQVQAARVDLEAFEDLMFRVLEAWGLPTDNIIVAAKQRETLFKNAPGVIEELTAEERANAPYVAKMIMAGSVGAVRCRAELPLERDDQPSTGPRRRLRCRLLLRPRRD